MRHCVLRSTQARARSLFHYIMVNAGIPDDLRSVTWMAREARRVEYMKLCSHTAAQHSRARAPAARYFNRYPSHCYCIAAR